MARAGFGQEANERSQIGLDGSNSFDPDGDPLIYRWTQLSGPPVLLSDPRAEKPTFTAPEVIERTLLVFQLIVNDGAQDSLPDPVIMAIFPLPPSPPRLLTPSSGEIASSSIPGFSWEAAQDAESYRLEISVRPPTTVSCSFETLLHREEGLTETFFAPTVPLEAGKSYCWRVWAQNRVREIPSPPSAFFVAWPAGQRIFSWEGHLASGSGRAAYQMISFPLQTDEDPGKVLGATLGSYDPSRWRLFRHEGEKPVEYSTHLEKNRLWLAPGLGYWLISRKGGQIEVAGTPIDPSGPFSIPLEPGDGWREIGHPFAFPVNWKKVQVICRPGAEPVPIGEVIDDPNGCISGDLLTYERGHWRGLLGDELRLLLPWHGFLVYHWGTEGAKLLIPPLIDPPPLAPAKAAGDAASKARKAGEGASADADLSEEWQLRLEVSQGKLEGGQCCLAMAVLGVSSSSRNDYDRRDRLDPPRIFKELPSLYFPNEAWSHRPGRYSSDFRPPPGVGQSLSYEVVVEAGGDKGQLVLSWPGIDHVPMGYSLWLVDPGKRGSNPIDMRAKGSYRFNPGKKGKRRLQVIVAFDPKPWNGN